jgi:hypothetical protein
VKSFSSKKLASGKEATLRESESSKHLEVPRPPFDGLDQKSVNILEEHGR